MIDASFLQFPRYIDTIHQSVHYLDLQDDGAESGVVGSNNRWNRVHSSFFFVCGRNRESGKSVKELGGKKREEGDGVTHRRTLSFLAVEWMLTKYNKYR